MAMFSEFCIRTFEFTSLFVEKLLISMRHFPIALLTINSNIAQLLHTLFYRYCMTMDAIRRFT